MNSFRDASLKHRRGMAALALIAALCLCGCTGAPRDVSADESRLVAWWCEDVCHGIPREVGELRLVGASVGLQRVADWATGAENDVARHHLNLRRKRWPAIRSLLASGTLRSNADGLLIVADESRDQTGILAQHLADAENHDRRTVEVLVLTFTQPDERMAAIIRQCFIEARVAGDNRL